MCDERAIISTHEEQVSRGKGGYFKTSWRSLLAVLILPVWGVVLTLASTIMMARHTIPLPVPEVGDERIAQALQTQRERATTSWMMTHVLLSTCPCSHRITAHLLERGAMHDVEEHVVWIKPETPQEEGEEDFPKRARARGFIVHVVDHAELAQRYHLEAAPLLLIMDPEERLIYSGGYTSRKQGYAVQDLDILKTLRVRHGPVATLPLFGCAVSRELSATIDPTGWFSGR